MDAVPRMRMIAGPNGSGKSTIRGEVLEGLIGKFVNADEIGKALNENGLDLALFEIEATDKEWQAHALQSSLMLRACDPGSAMPVTVRENRLVRSGGPVNAYMATLVADFIRLKLIEARVSFTFETVMSSDDKIKVLKTARQAGFRTYLYFISTQDPDINVARVKHRVASGGHDVPEAKIRSRYVKSLDNLFEAIRNTDRAFMFDNSGERFLWFAEITGGEDLVYTADLAPAWFQAAVLDKKGKGSA